ncbi:MAG: HPr family phosphocarrier protein [Cephaloticoccus sp.]|nr:HPr family phosphocarrier protein [Cephaloticoccus sp.]MCF7761159.1 HPr family phosphocarrier protein [Cephaloticoccus sp.]
MKRAVAIVPWRDGLHLRPAARLVQEARKFQSTVILKCGGRMADLRSVLSLLALCAALGATLEIEAVGDDEQNAAEAVERVFAPEADPTDSADMM